MWKILSGDLVWFRPQVMVSRGFSNPGDPMDLVNRDFPVVLGLNNVERFLNLAHEIRPFEYVVEIQK